MGKLDKQFEEDLALRNTARKIFLDDVTHAKASFSSKGVADRVGGRIGDGVKETFWVAKTHSKDNRGLIALAIGALLIWLARNPIMEALGLLDEAAQELGLDLESALAETDEAEAAEAGSDKANVHIDSASPETPETLETPETNAPETEISPDGPLDAGETEALGENNEH